MMLYFRESVAPTPTPTSVPTSTPTPGATLLLQEHRHPTPAPTNTPTPTAMVVSTHSQLVASITRDPSPDNSTDETDEALLDEDVIESSGGSVLGTDMNVKSTEETRNGNNMIAVIFGFWGLVLGYLLWLLFSRHFAIIRLFRYKSCKIYSWNQNRSYFPVHIRIHMIWE